MKFKDIPKMTQSGQYAINVRLSFLKKQLEEYQDRNFDYALQLNPDFQRGHVWTEQQQINFVEYFLKGGKVNPIYLNQSGWMTDYKGDFVCVDGLQRITALLKFTDNKIKAYDTYYKDFEGICSSTIVIDINNLKTKEEVLQWYVELNEGGTPHTKEEIDKVKKMLKSKETM